LSGKAKAIGSLNHPNICQLYDVGPNYLVMEYVEGAQLKGPLPRFALHSTTRTASDLKDELEWIAI
jgi:eukaryotic-like serine/threonine-protein kinase